MYEFLEQNNLTEYLANPDVRHLYLDSSIRHLLAMQLKSMREDREWSQADVGEKAGGMKQSAIARLEDPEYSSMTLSTLKRLAKAFDVALIVRFAPFSEFISWTAQLDAKRLTPPGFIQEQVRPSSEILVNWPSTANTRNVNEYGNEYLLDPSLFAAVYQGSYSPFSHSNIMPTIIPTKERAEEVVRA